jgi:hypothetical protein
MSTTIDQQNNEVFQKYYDELAPIFLDYKSGQEEFTKLVDINSKCVEIGSGTGLFILPLLSNGYCIDGIEPNLTFVEKFKQQNQTATIYRCLITEFDFNDHNYNVVFSHSGPFLFTKHEGNLYFEGMIRTGLDENKNMLKIILTYLQKQNGMFMINIQENKSNIELSDNVTYTLNVLYPYYDCESMQVSKEYAFQPIKHPESYTKFACSLDQFTKMIEEFGDFSIETHEKWVVVKPNMLKF